MDMLLSSLTTFQDEETHLFVNDYKRVRSATCTAGVPDRPAVGVSLRGLRHDRRERRQLGRELLKNIRLLRMSKVLKRDFEGDPAGLDGGTWSSAS